MAVIIIGIFIHRRWEMLLFVVYKLVTVNVCFTGKVFQVYMTFIATSADIFQLRVTLTDILPESVVIYKLVMSCW